MITNPGCGPVQGATKADADHNILAFVQEAGLKVWTRIQDLDGDGRFGYSVEGESGAVFEVLMPGIALEDVRDASILCAPRLYIDGSSWWWSFALDIVSQGQ